MKIIPAIICDLDGVILKSRSIIQRAKLGLDLIRRPLMKLFPQYNINNNIDKIPLIFFTNGGGYLEKDKAQDLNQILNYTNTDKQFLPNDIILNFTPMRPQMLKYSSECVLITGVGDIERIAKSCQLNKYITFNEYIQLQSYNQQIGNIYPFWEEIQKIDVEIDLLKNLQKRLHMSKQELIQSKLMIQAIFILDDLNYWEKQIEIISKIIANFTIAKIEENISKLNNSSIQYKLPIYAVHEDRFYPDKFQNVRICLGSFLKILAKILNQSNYSNNYELFITGKPNISSFRYVQDYIIQRFNNYKISKFYMVGDTPQIDIKTANQLGWCTILVEQKYLIITLFIFKIRTGNYIKGKSITDCGAQYIVEDFWKAINLISYLENINIEDY